MESFYKVFGCITVTRKQEVTAPALAGKLDAGVPVLNKKAITTYAKRAMAANNSQVHLVILDIDDFKSINDTFGHMFGDEVLLKAAEIIKESIGSAGVAGRIGGDEMLIVLTGIESHTELRNTLRSIRTGIEWAYQGVRDNLHVTCSIGVATYPEHGDNYDKIFQLADRMLYIAKSKGKNRYVIYTPELHDNKLKNKDTGKKSSADSLKNDKTGVMRRLIEDFLVRKIVPYSTALQEIGFCFELDEIIMVYGNMKLSSTWNHEGFFDDREEGAYLNPDPGFFDCFDENNILAVNGIFNLEGKSTVFPELLTSRGIESVLFYKMTHSDQAFGYIMFAKKNRRQMWAEYDKTLLASVGKILELSFRGK
jgi:diguanylate cyclase (GGDEF)-like protein